VHTIDYEQGIGDLERKHFNTEVWGSMVEPSREFRAEGKKF